MSMSTVAFLAAVAAGVSGAPAAPDAAPASAETKVPGVDEIVQVSAYQRPIGPPVMVAPRAALFADVGPADVVQHVNAAAASAAAVPLGSAPAAGSRSLLPRISMWGRRLDGLVDDFKQPAWDSPEWYLFAGSDGQAMTWAPRNDRDLRLQDRPSVGEIQAGVSYQTGPLQASIAYVEQEVSNTQRSDRQGFTGVSVTLRR